MSSNKDELINVRGKQFSLSIFETDDTKEAIEDMIYESFEE
jgi:hypothetical protein